MKTRLKPILFAAFVFLSATPLHAASYLTGKYLGVLFQNGELYGAINLTINGDGTVTGKGTDFDLFDINVTGAVSSTGGVTLVETDDGDQAEYTGSFKPSRKKFAAVLDNYGDFIQGRRLAGDFPVAGVYFVELDRGDVGFLLVNKDGTVDGIIYDDDNNADNFVGTATNGGIDGTTGEGLGIEVTFDGSHLSGTYDDGEGAEGSLSGSKY